jgi:hypothetical protein
MRVALYDCTGRHLTDGKTIMKFLILFFISASRYFSHLILIPAWQRILFTGDLMNLAAAEAAVYPIKVNRVPLIVGLSITKKRDKY